jgi:hypothetical protein
MKTCTMLIFFTGHGEPIGHATGFVVSRATGTVLAVDAGADLPAEGAFQVPTRAARFETAVMARGDQTWEAGRVEFPEIASTLDVDTVVPGRVDVLPGGEARGSISWRVRGGTGHFEGATGIVTGNFVGHPDGSFSDHQLFKLVLPAH